MAVDAKPLAERVLWGKGKEVGVISCLNEMYGYNLVPANLADDTQQRTDCWEEQDGQRRRCAIKARDSKDDILVCLRDPFYGFKEKRPGGIYTRKYAKENNITLVGRDVMYEYHWYITLNKWGDTIRVADGKRIHEISLSLWNEFRQRYPDFDPRKCRHRKSTLIMSSDYYSGVLNEYGACEMWYHHDASDCQPKILAFIPSQTLLEGKEIFYHLLPSGYLED